MGYWTESDCGWRIYGKIRLIFMPQESLKNKTVKGVGWSAVDNVAQYAVSFVVGIVLARLLSPDDYGLIGIITIFTAVCTAIINGGFSTALIRKNDCTDDDYNTAFIVNLGLSLVLYAVIFVCSPLIANFFGKQELVALTRVSSVTMIVKLIAIYGRQIVSQKSKLPDSIHCNRLKNSSYGELVIYKGKRCEEIYCDFALICQKIVVPLQKLYHRCVVFGYHAVCVINMLRQWKRGFI